VSGTLAIDYAAQTAAGNKVENADAADALVPRDGQLLSKGIAVAIADGVSSSEGGREASQLCVTGFLNDYFSTPESWTVKTSAGKVLGALNRWLFANGQQRYDSARGMVTTFTGLVLKSTTAHVFHVGDSRLYLYRDHELEQLTRDHRVWVSQDRDFLSRAMGIDASVEIDYAAHAVEPGDLYLFTTDGISGHVTDHRLRELLGEHNENLQVCAKAILEEALHNESSDNVTCQVLRVLSLPTQTEDDILQQITELPFPPDLAPGMKIDGYEILRELHASHRSEVFLANDIDSGDKVILKTPSVNFRDDPAYLEGFLHEEWVGKRIRNPHVLRVLETPRRRFLYNVSEFIEGQSLRQWITDHPQTHINKARDFLNQLAEGLRTFHRLEMIHLDLKPENVLVDQREVLRIIDFGSTFVAGSSEIARDFSHTQVQGTVNYSAPECAENHCSTRSDIYSLGVIAYELMTGALPYGESERIRAADKLKYVPASQHNPHIQPWVDGALRKAVHPNPAKRYDSLSEFMYDLSHPNEKFIVASTAPLIERDPLGFWRGLSALLLFANLILLYLLSRH